MKRPLSVTIVAILFLVVGVSAVIAGAVKMIGGRSAALTENLLVLGINALAMITGVGLLRGSNWARFLAAGWMVFHVILSFWHTPLEVVLHALMLGAISYFLFCQNAASYFTPQSVRSRAD